jgi:hypothetical protein
MIKLSPLAFTSRWIKGHQQDDSQSSAPLDRWGKLDVECNGLAKGIWNANTLAKTWAPSFTSGLEKGIVDRQEKAL